MWCAPVSVDSKVDVGVNAAGRQHRPCRHWACQVKVGLAESTLGLLDRHWAYCVNVGLATSTFWVEGKEHRLAKS